MWVPKIQEENKMGRNEMTLAGGITVLGLILFNLWMVVILMRKK